MLYKLDHMLFRDKKMAKLFKLIQKFVCTKLTEALPRIVFRIINTRCKDSSDEQYSCTGFLYTT